MKYLAVLFMLFPALLSLLLSLSLLSSPVEGRRINEPRSRHLSLLEEEEAAAGNATVASSEIVAVDSLANNDVGSRRQVKKKKKKKQMKRKKKQARRKKKKMNKSMMKRKMMKKKKKPTPSPIASPAVVKTVGDTTHEPTNAPTGQPTTQGPTSENATSDFPRSSSPTSDVPDSLTSESPTSESPTSGKPTSLSPNGSPTTTSHTDAPSGSPASDSPTSQSPTEPTSLSPTDAPTSNNPTSQAPTSDEPTSLSPTDVPTSDNPTSQAPTSDNPTSENPTSSQTSASTIPPTTPAPPPPIVSGPISGSIGTLAPTSSPVDYETATVTQTTSSASITYQGGLYFARVKWDASTYARQMGWHCEVVTISGETNETTSSNREGESVFFVRPDDDGACVQACVESALKPADTCPSLSGDADAREARKDIFDNCCSLCSGTSASSFGFRTCNYPVTVTATPEPYGWYAGGYSESCSDVCSDKGLDGYCNVDAIKAIDTTEKAITVAAEVGFVYDEDYDAPVQVNGYNLPMMPSVYDVTGGAVRLGFWTDSSTAQTTCDGKHGASRRICCCSPDGSDCQLPVSTQSPTAAPTPSPTEASGGLNAVNGGSGPQGDTFLNLSTYTGQCIDQNNNLYDRNAINGINTPLDCYNWAKSYNDDNVVGFAFNTFTQYYKCRIYFTDGGAARYAPEAGIENSCLSGTGEVQGGDGDDTYTCYKIE